MTNIVPRTSSAKRARAVRAPAHLPWLLRRVNQRYRSTIRDRLVAAGFGDLPQPGYWALMALARGATEAGELSAEMGVSKQAVSKLIEALVTSRLVGRKPNPEDRRRTELALTARGRKAAAVIEDAARTTQETFVDEVGSDRFANLVDLLTQLVDGPVSR